MATALTLGVQANVTLGGANVVTRIDPPANARRVRLLARTADAKLVLDSAIADAGVLGGTAYETLPANVPLEFPVPGANRSRNIDSAAAASNSRRFFLASATASLVVEVTALP